VDSVLRSDRRHGHSGERPERGQEVDLAGRRPEGSARGRAGHQPWPRQLGRPGGMEAASCPTWSLPISSFRLHRLAIIAHLPGMGANVRIIAMSGSAEALQAARGLGVFTILRKPITLSDSSPPRIRRCGHHRWELESVSAPHLPSIRRGRLTSSRCRATTSFTSSRCPRNSPVKDRKPSGVIISTPPPHGRRSRRYPSRPGSPLSTWAGSPRASDALRGRRVGRLRGAITDPADRLVVAAAAPAGLLALRGGHADQGGPVRAVWVREGT
jgi:hypothetical protein